MRSVLHYLKYVSLQLTLIVFASACFAQHHPDMIESGGQKQLPGSISGSVSPQSIPDSIAYLMFFKILSASNASPQHIDRQRAIVRLAALSENDFAQLGTVMENFGVLMATNTSNIQSEEKRQGGPNLKTLEDLIATRMQIVDDTWAALETLMTSEGVKRLHDLIISEKRNMSVIVGPDMAEVGTKQ